VEAEKKKEGRRGGRSSTEAGKRVLMPDAGIPVDFQLERGTSKERNRRE
jgi:hypothetical protein